MSRWERILLVLGVCLPVPLLAATGLSIPLPATVERLAAGLVPFAEAATLARDDESTRATRGVIVRVPGEAAPDGGSASTPFVPADSGATDRPSAPTRGSRPDAEGAAPTSHTTGRPRDDPSAPDTPAATGDPKPTPVDGGGAGGTSPAPPPPQTQPEPQPQPQPGPQPQPAPQPQPQPTAPPPPPPPPPPAPSPSPPPPPPPPSLLPIPLPIPLPLPPPPKLPGLGL